VPLVLHRINLTQFRSYDALRLDTGGARMLVLTGANGAGKTNILEAVSLLAPGRGLRGAGLDALKNRNADAAEQFGVAADIETAEGHQLRIGTGSVRDGRKRVVRINGRDAKNQNELAAFMAAVWLTPQMDRLFLDGAALRRKFVDRLVLAFDPEHAARLNRYEKKLRERLRLLETGGGDARWLATLESGIAADGIAVAAARTDMLLHLEKYIALLATRQNLFPAPSVVMTGDIDACLSAMTALDAEDMFLRKLQDGRALDGASGRTMFGAHRSDVNVAYAAKQMPAGECSTGEQKGMMLSIILAHALMMQAEKGFVPLILLDEVAAHLDEARREQLLLQLSALDAQVWLTGTDAEIFSGLSRDAAFFHVTPAGITAQKKLVAV
jgi:DNA replication and repair protein RecF